MMKKNTIDLLKELCSILRQGKTEIPDETKKLIDETIKLIENSTKISNSILTLRRRMKLTNIWFHPVRNNPRHRDQYYFGLIPIVGYENWQKVNDTIRMNWESARLSFDKMYGMVKNFAEHIDEYSSVFGDTEPDKTKTEEFRQKVVNSLNDMKNSIYSFNDNYGEF